MGNDYTISREGQRGDVPWLIWREIGGVSCTHEETQLFTITKFSFENFNHVYYSISVASFVTSRRVRSISIIIRLTVTSTSQLTEKVANVFLIETRRVLTKKTSVTDYQRPS